MHRDRFEKVIRRIGYEGEIINTLQSASFFYGILLDQLAKSNKQEFRIAPSIAALLSYTMTRVREDVSVHEFDLLGSIIVSTIDGFQTDRDGWTSCASLNAIKSIGFGIKGLLRTGVNDWPMTSVTWTASLIHPHDANAAAKLKIVIAEAAFNSVRKFPSDHENRVAQLTPGMTLSKADVYSLHSIMELVRRDTEDNISAYEKGRLDGERSKGYER